MSHRGGARAGSDASAGPGGEVFKVSGAGNDFVAFVEPERDPTAAEIRAWCARGFAFGADGVFVLRRVGSGMRMDHWNSDGGPVATCLNGTRCATRLAFELGWAEREIAIATGAGEVIGRRIDRPGLAAILVPAPAEPAQPVEVEVSGRRHSGFTLTVGVPHFVVVSAESLAAVPVAGLGPPLRRHPAFGPEGANVDWIRFPDPATMEIRTFERGVEGETLACGTGILACFLVGRQLGLCRPRIEARVLGGFALAVEALPAERPATLLLEGDARVAARLELGADAAIPTPPTPRWSR